MSRNRGVVQLARAGKPLGRQAVWAEIRRMRSFTIRQLALNVEQPQATVKDYVLGLHAAGYLRVEGKEEPSKGVLAVRAAFLSSVYVLERDVGVEAPRVTRDGTAVTDGLAREQMWRTMRMIRTDFTARELSIQASTDAVIIDTKRASEYLRYLTRAGYLTTPQAGRSAQPTRYRFVAARYTGPLAPIVAAVKSVFDPNTQEIVWNAEVDA